MKTANRKFSRLLACALVFLLALTAYIPVFAERTSVNQDNLQVVIHNNDGLPAMSTNQFTVYQLFTGTPHEESDTGNPEYGADNWNNYTLADVKWGESITDNGTALLAALTAVTDDWAMESEDNIFTGITDAAGLAKVLENHNTNDFMQHFATTVATVSNLKAVSVTPVLTNGTTDAEDYLTYTFTTPGYYMFADTHTLSTTEADARSEYILAVLGDQEINLKASVPQVDKDIVVGIDDKKGDAAGVGDYVQFKLTGTLPKNFADFDFYEYIFHDTLSKGLEYVKDDTAHPLEIRVYDNQAAADADVTHTGGTLINVNKTAEAKNYSVSTEGSEESNPCNLEISFDDLKALSNEGTGAISVTSESVFVVTYYAKVTENAVLLSEGNPNSVVLEYSNDPNHEGTGKTKEKKVYIYAFGLDLTKVGSDAAHDDEGLKGAGFLLKDKDGNYAIFKDQYTNADHTAFSDVKDDTYTEGPVRRLTGWTDAAGSETVKTAIETYKTKKADFDKVTNEERAEGSSAYEALQAAKEALAEYLLESGADGAIPDVYGLDAGDYSLEEAIVPDGYNTPKDDFDISITANINSDGILQSVTYKHGEDTITYKGEYPDDEGVPKGDTAENMVAHFNSGLIQDDLINQKAPFLPFTGGIGTLILYILGAALIAGAVTYLVIALKKRKKAENSK